MSAKVVIETHNLTKVYRSLFSRFEVKALDNLNLEVYQGEIFGLLGPNGSGKTTTMKILLGLINPTGGEALVLGKSPHEVMVKDRIGFLPEETYLHRFLNADETLDFYGQLFKLPAKVRKMRIEALLDMVGLKAVANRTIGTFSKGMARRIGLAQALINDPELLILDEPTTGLDPIGTRQIKDLILELAKRGKTILLCSHLLADVEDVCDRIAILYGGKVQAEGDVRNLLRHSDKTEITTSRLSDAALEKIKQTLSAEHAEYTIDSPLDKLETFFINIVNKAQQQAVPTSGAESKTQISDFLSAGADERTRREAILNELVSASSSEQQKVSTDTKVVTPSSVQTDEVDENLLKQLAEQSDSKPVVTQPAKTKPVEAKSDLPNKSVLDELTGRSNPDTKKTHPGDSANA